MATNNATILASAWLEGSSDYQQRLPEIKTQADVDRTAKLLFEPYNGRYLNEFSAFLFGRIADQYVHNKAWKNPLRFLKKAAMPYGMTFEETALKWVKAHSYNSDDVKTETLLKTHYPEGRTVFHSQNRQDDYEISTGYDALRTAFTGENGLANYISSVMQVPYNSDEYDEYNIMVQLFAKMDKYHGIYRDKIDAPNDVPTARAMLKKLRTYARLLTFPSTIYNAQDVNDIPVFAKPTELLLFVTPEVEASLDVDGLAPLFHMEKADYTYRVIVVREFPMPDVQAILTTEDFFMVKDTVYRTTEFYNPHSLVTNYYLHHWGVYSASPFVPAIAFTTAESTVIPVITVNVTGMNVTAPTNVYLNDVEGASFNIELEGTVTPPQGENGVEVKPDSATYTILSVKDGANAIPFNPMKVYMQNNELFVGANTNSKLYKAVEAGTAEIEVQVSSVYDNPSGETNTYEEVIKIKPEMLPTNV